MTADVSDVSGAIFDFIIVGGGTAGLTLANRLTEDARVSVLVLEAGEANLDDKVNLIPGQRMVQFNNPKYDWAFKTVEQVNSNNRPYVWPRGKGLGGSSAINFLLWNKPARQYLEAFGELGVKGWNWDLFEKYSKRSERFVPPDHDLDVLTYDKNHRGDSGAIAVSFPTVISNVERPLIEAMKKHGIAHIADSSSGFTNGTSVTACTLDPKTHFRSYSANMYYQPVASRPNLKVLVSAQATGVVTRRNDDGTVSATAVTFMHDGKVHQARCAREVCLAAGAVMSPQILELSGIGDRAVLEKVGIEVKVDLPGVGSNVQEHLYTGMTWELKEPVIDGREVFTYDPLFFPEEAAKQVEMHPQGKGALNLSAVSLTFLPLDTISADAHKLRSTLTTTIREDMKAHKYPKGLQKQYELQLKHLDDQVPSLEIMLGPGAIAPPPVMDIKKKHVTFCFALNTPFSRGTIHVDSKDPLAHPIIDPHIFEQPYDLHSMVELAKFVRRLGQTEPLKSLFKDEMFPGPKVQSDAELAEWIRNVVETTYHTVGSCSMLPLEDGGVVDSELKVYNTTNIRVVDLSVIPLHIGSHTQAMAYAVGEQAADIIKGRV